MPYRYALERPDYSDLASGRVLHSLPPQAGLPGSPAFPVRLASEIFLTCLALRRTAGVQGPCRLYDPCCGSGYLVSVLGWLHGEQIGALIASDIQPRAVETARRNLALLTPQGLDARRAEIDGLLRQYGKDSHREALESAARLAERLPGALPTLVFQADAADPAALRVGLGETRPDLVITDLPYGQHSAWDGAASQSENPAAALLEALRAVLAPGAIIAAAADKGQKIIHPAFRRLRHLRAGKRQVIILGV